MKIDYVNKEDKTLKKILKEDLELSSRLISELIRGKHITVDDKLMRLNENVFKGSKVSIDLGYETNTYEPYEMAIDVVYEDDMIIVVNKNSGVVVHPTNGVKTGTLLNGITYYQKINGQDYKVRFVNRIDMGTSGIVVVAKNKYSMNKFSNELSNRRVKKEYLAVVSGELTKEIIVDKPLLKELDSPKRVVDSNGKKAITNIIPIRSNGEHTLVRAIPLTGRTHQIRSHLAHIGHPIVGDELYGKEEYSRLMLHCEKMTFEDLDFAFEAKADEIFNGFIRRGNE